jgi:UDP-galactopyranose mutase
MSENIEIEVNNFLQKNKNIVESFEYLVKLYNEKRLTIEFFSMKSNNLLFSLDGVYNNKIVPYIYNFIGTILKVDKLNDKILLNRINEINNIVFLMWSIYLLIRPSLLENSEDDIIERNQKIHRHLDKLLVILKKPVFKNVDHFNSIFICNYNYYHVYNGYNNKELYIKIAKLFKQLCPDLNYKSPKLNLIKKNNKIRIGFISGFLTKYHSVCKDRIGIIRSLILDPSFEVFIITNNKEELTLYKEVIDKLRFNNKIVLPNKIADCRKIIENLELNILVYCEIGMDPTMYKLAFSKLAPIQLNTWGHSETSGIDTIDYFISSKYYETKNGQDNYSEKLITLDSLCTFYYSLRIYNFANNFKPDRKQILLKYNLPSNCNVYGIVQTVFKYHPDNIKMIKSIMEKDTKGIMVFLSYPGLEERFMDWLEYHLGHLTTRTRILSRVAPNDFYELISSFDIILDSYPFGGCNSSLEAFYYNKIVLTLPSDKINGRFTLGFYEKMGIKELVCNNFDDFIKKAILYGTNKEERQKMERLIESRKNLLFEEKESIDTWRTKMIEFSNKFQNDNKLDVDVIVVGAGLSGSIIAERYAKLLNKKVLIIDKREHIGGNCYDFINELGIRESKYGAHLFHTNNERVWDYVQRYSKWIPWEHKVLANVDNKLVPIPVNINTVNQIFGLSISNEKEMNEFLESKQIKYDNITNSEEMCKSRVGEELYEKLFKYYTKKQWDKYPDELDKSVTERIPVRNNFDDRYFTDKYQYLPEDGYTNFISNILKHPNIKIMLNTDYNEIKQNINERTLIFFTGPIDQYFEKYGLPKLEYRSINFKRQNLDVDYYQKNSVINYPGNNVEYTRIVEYKHFLNQQAKGTTIVYETSTDEGEPYYPVPNQKNQDLYDRYKKLADLEVRKNVYFVGRLANYKYFNMDQAIFNSIELFENISKKDYEIVIARYNENVDWLNDYKFMSTIYNKGDDNIEGSITLPNIGRESHTYLYHIINNYDKLANITLFAQGKISDHTKMSISEYLNCKNIKYNSGTAPIHLDNANRLRHHGKWLNELISGKMKKSELDFKSWWIKNVRKPYPQTHPIYSPGAIFSLTKSQIHKHPKQYYLDLIKNVDNHINPEEGHYFERSWIYIFE